VPPARYLRVIGRLTADNRLVLRPSYLSDRPRHPEPRRKSGLLAELFDDGGRLLLRHPLRLQPMCGDGQPLSSLVVRGWVPFPAATRLIRFSHEGLPMEEIRVSEGAPEIRLTWRPPPEPAGPERITWEASHPEARPLQFLARYTHTDGQRWLRLGWRTDARMAEVDFGQLPGGDRCRLAIVATDGVNTTTAESGHIPCPRQAMPRHDLRPRRGGDGQWSAPPSCCAGRGTTWKKRSRRPRPSTWTSSRDGDLGPGTLLTWSPRAAGEHRVTLAPGTGRRQGTTAITIRVEPEPGRPADTSHSASA
jgi:hypothetical protein